MELIDEHGNLFGVVNVIDVLVVLVLLAVVVAGVAFVTMGGAGGGAPSDSDGDEATRYATLELGEQPDYVVERLEEGDIGTIAGTDSNATVTEIEHPSASGYSDLTIRAELEGTLLEDETGDETFEVAGEPLRLGRGLGLDMGLYSVNGTVTDVGTEPELASEVTTTTVDVELENVSPAIGDALEEGMVVTERGETVATLEELERGPAVVVLQSEDGELHEREHPRNEDVTLTLGLQTVETSGKVYHRGERLGVGSEFKLKFEAVVIEGEVTRVE